MQSRVARLAWFLLHIATCLLTVIISIYLVWQLYLQGRMQQRLLFTLIIVALIVAINFFYNLYTRHKEEEELVYQQARAIAGLVEAIGIHGPQPGAHQPVT